MQEFGELCRGDRFRYAGSLWTKVDYNSARKHSGESIALRAIGYGYIGDSICSFEPTDRVEFVAP